MQLEEMTLPYHRIYSLGSSCEVAHQLRRKGLRKEAGPFDWFVSYSPKRLAEQIEGRFRQFMKLNNLKLLRRLKTTYALKDEVSLCISYHDFPLKDGEEDWKQDYPAFYSKVQRRTARFLDALKSEMPILLIRVNCSKEDALALQYALDCHSPPASKPHLLILNVGPKLILEDQWGFDRICSLQITKGDTWMGNDDCWDQVLNRIKLQ